MIDEGEYEKLLALLRLQGMNCDDQQFIEDLRNILYDMCRIVADEAMGTWKD